MSKLVGLSALLCLASCAGPPFYRPPEYPPIPGISAGDTPERVQELLGKPDDWSNGRWFDGGVGYRPYDQIWYYAGKGRVIFDGFSGRVVETEYDPYQPKYGLPSSYSGL